VAVGLVRSRLVVERAGYGLLVAALLIFALLRLDVPPVEVPAAPAVDDSAPLGLPLALVGDIATAVLLVLLGVVAATYTSARRS
jgi:hypothetical protein